MFSTIISEKSLKKGVGVILRLPALFILEMWYKTEPDQMIQVSSDTKITVTVLYYLVFLLAVAIGSLPLEKLVTFYMYAVSSILLSASYFLSSMFVEKETNENMSYNITQLLTHSELLERVLLHLVSQCFIAAIIAYLVEMTNWSKYLLLVFTMPVFARLIGFSPDLLLVVHNFASVFTLLMIVFYLFNNLSNIIDICQDSINQAYFAFKTFGPLPVLITFWKSVLLSVQMLIFWVLMFSCHLYLFIMSDDESNRLLFEEGWIVVILASLGECCTTPVSLFAFCVMISYTSFGVLTLTKFYLQGFEMTPLDFDGSRGWTEGFTMLLIAVQTDLLDLSILQRAFLMSILLFIVISSLIQSMYEIVDPILLTLSASHNKRWIKHARAIGLCTFLWMFPLFMSYFICQYFDLDFWLMVIISSCLLTSVQVIGSLVVYSLFIYDSFRTEPWESLDDVIYWARACTRVVEFLVAVFVVCYGFKESIFGEWSLVNISILLIHCYFNVWQRLQSGWKSFLLRWKAVKKVESLLLATSEQLENYNDVCSICFQEMKAARITHCKHFFHGVCLRKWLYIKETCPMCHQEICKSNESGNETANNVDDGDGLNEFENFNDFDFSTDEDQSDIDND